MNIDYDNTTKIMIYFLFEIRIKLTILNKLMIFKFEVFWFFNQTL